MNRWPGAAGCSRDVTLRGGYPQVRGRARPPTQVVAKFIEDNREEFGAEPIFRTLAATNPEIELSIYSIDRAVTRSVQGPERR